MKIYWLKSEIICDQSWLLTGDQLICLPSFLPSFHTHTHARMVWNKNYKCGQDLMEDHWMEITVCYRSGNKVALNINEGRIVHMDNWLEELWRDLQGFFVI